DGHDSSSEQQRNDASLQKAIYTSSRKAGVQPLFEATAAECVYVFGKPGEHYPVVVASFKKAAAHTAAAHKVKLAERKLRAKRASLIVILTVASIFSSEIGRFRANSCREERSCHICRLLSILHC